MKRHPLLALCAAILCWACASVAHAQPPPQPGRFAVSGTLGVLHPLRSEMSDVYGGALIAVTGHVDIRLAPDVSFFGGLKRTDGSGRSVVIGAPVADERYAAQIRMASFRFGALVSHRLGARLTLAGGAGASVTAYEEAWPDAGLDVRDHATGFIALAEGRYALRARWAALIRFEYSTIPATAKATSVAANLGGLDVSAGVRYAF